jgi:hypothetical protein
MKRVARLCIVCCIALSLATGSAGCALLGLPLGLLSALVSLPLGLVNTLFSLIGPATSAAAAAAPYALLLVKNDAGDASAVRGGKRDQRLKIEDLRQQDLPIDEVVLAKLNEDPQISSVIFVVLDDSKKWHRFQESLDILSARGCETTCVIMKKGKNSVRQDRIDAVSEIMEKRGISFYRSV